MMLIKVLTGWVAGAAALTGATQLRADGVPLGAGELLLALWLILVAFCLLRGVRFGYSDAFRILSVYWGISAVLLGFGTVMALHLERLDALTATHDALAFALVASLACLLGLRLGGPQTDYHWSLARATFIAVGGSSILLFALSLVTPELGPLQLWYFESRFQGWAENPNQLALFVVAMPFLGWHLATRADGLLRKLLYLIGICGCLVVGVATGSDALRVAWALTLAGLLLWTWLRAAVRAQGKVMYLSHVIVPIVVLSLAAALGSELVEQVEQISERVYEEGEQGDTRVLLWSHGIEAMMHSPLMGLGPGAYSGLHQPFDRGEAHNSLIDWGMSTGLLGVALHLGLWALCLWRALRLGTPALAGMVAALSLFSLFGYSLRHPIYWLLLVLILALTERRAFATAPRTAAPPAVWQGEQHRAAPAFLVQGTTPSS